MIYMYTVRFMVQLTYIIVLNAMNGFHVCLHVCMHVVMLHFKNATIYQISKHVVSKVSYTVILLRKETRFFAQQNFVVFSVFLGKWYWQIWNWFIRKVIRITYLDRKYKKYKFICVKIENFGISFVWNIWESGTITSRQFIDKSEQ